MPIDIKKNIDEIREDFPMLKKKPHYLSSCGRGPQPRQSYEAMREYIKTEMINLRAEGKMEEYRENAAKLINAQPEEISFAKTTTEGICMFATAIVYEPEQNIVITDLNFPSNSMIWYHHARRKQLQVREARAIPYEDMTEIPIEVIADQVDKNTRVISVDHCIFSHGYRMDLEELAKIAHEVGAYLIADGVQALGAMTLDVRKTNIDAYSTAGYKYMLAPRGSALFFVSNRIIDELHPIHVGPHGIKDFHEKISYDLSSRHYTRPYYDLAPSGNNWIK
jgi:selenocysteine lyase/cysteine desulfurase